MLLQISSGQGPVECEYAVGLLFQALQKEYPDIEMLYQHPGHEKNCYRSILFSTAQDMSELDGSVQWICQSPFRPNHKRKNWFVDVSVIPEMELEHIEIFEEEGKTLYRLKGDNNNSPDKDSVEYSQIQGGILFKIDKIGIIIAKLSSRIGMIIVIVLIGISYMHSSRSEEKRIAREDARKRFNVPKY